MPFVVNLKKSPEYKFGDARAVVFGHHTSAPEQVVVTLLEDSDDYGLASGSRLWVHEDDLSAHPSDAEILAEQTRLEREWLERVFA